MPTEHAYQLMQMQFPSSKLSCIIMEIVARILHGESFLGIAWAFEISLPLLQVLLVLNMALPVTGSGLARPALTSSRT